MNSSRIFNNLEDLKERTNQAFNSPADILTLTKIKDELLEVKPEHRVHFAEFVKDFAKRLFKSGIGLPGQSLANYQLAIAKTLEVKKVPLKKNNFEETFKLAIKCLKSELETLKNYYFITLNFDDSQNYDLLILHDDNYFVVPYKNCLKKNFEDLKIYTIEDFHKNLQLELASGKSNLKNYICLILLKSKMNSRSEIHDCNENLKRIVKLFDSAESISIKSLNTDEKFYLRKPLAEKDYLEDDFFDEIEFLTYTFLTNTELLFEEEKLIKLLFKNYDCPLLEYRLIERGNSGANVIEIRPKQAINDAQSRKFIVKYRPLSDSKKLNEEATNFNKYLGILEGFSDYTCIHQKTFTHEGILYSYAKSDFEKFSFPFSAVIDKPTNEFHNDAPKSIDRLFANDIFGHWEKTEESKVDKIGELYKPLIKLDVYDKIQEILDIDRIKLENLPLIKNFDKIKEHEITTKVKVCHGDLHTNNFFIDNRNIFLIDFGFTQILPHVVDHAFLEASIKFNHIPRFIELKLLKSLEEELLDDKTFSAEYNFKSQNRGDLKYYLDIISRIRVNANKLLSNDNKLEYLISLFMVTFKMIKYSDLNQLYALQSANLLSEEIVRQI